MEINERSELTAQLYKLQADCFTAKTRASDNRCLSIFAALDLAGEAVTEALNEITGKDETSAVKYP